MKEDEESWKNFLVRLKGRGLDGVRLLVGDKSLGVCVVAAEVFPTAKYQRLCWYAHGCDIFQASIVGVSAIFS